MMVKAKGKISHVWLWLIPCSLFASVFLWFIIYDIPYQSAKNTRYFKALGLELTGVVSSVETVGNGSGVLSVAIRNSNVKHYDLRNTSKRFYCVIDSGIAKIVEGGIKEVETGDSLVVSCKQDSVTVYRRDAVLLKYKLQLRMGGGAYASDYERMLGMR